MWPAEELLGIVTEGSLNPWLLPDERDALARYSREELLHGTRQLLTRPMPLGQTEAARAISGPILAAQWTALFADLDLPREAFVAEVCAGGSPPVLLGLCAHTEGRGRYVGVNLNRRLGAQLQERAAPLPLEATFIEANALNLLDHVAPGSADAVAFHHAVNDILQTAVADVEQVDTLDLEWWGGERSLIEHMRAFDEAGRLEEVGWEALRRIIAAGVAAVRPGGFLPFDHWTFEGYRTEEWFPWQLFTEMIPRTRGLAAAFPVREVTPACLDPQWWMVWQKVG
jgi:hypothetical protein